MSIVNTQLSYSTLGHVFSSIRAISPSEAITRRLNSMEAIIFHQATEENVEDEIILCDFQKLIHPTPFKSSPKRISTPKSSLKSSIRVVQKFIPMETEHSYDPRVTQASRDRFSSRPKRLSNAKSMDSEKGQKQGILKTGTKSRFAKYSRGSSLQNEIGTIKVKFIG